MVISVAAGLAFRRRFAGSSLVFYMAIASLDDARACSSAWASPSCFQLARPDAPLVVSALGAHLTWTLPFGLLIMFAVFGRFNRRYEEAARDLGASRWQTLTEVVLPILRRA